MIQTLHSKEDNSVNFIMPGGFECRYVRREQDKVIVYLSSQGSCAQACRMCFLTQQRKEKAQYERNATFVELATQFITVMNHYNMQDVKANKLHINFMARGEPMLNAKAVRSNEWKNILANHAPEHLQEVHLNVSTIMPKNMAFDAMYPGLMPTRFYYSIYSVDPKWRRRWLPNAMDIMQAQRKLNEYYLNTDIPATLHFAFIKGENDSLKDAEALREYIKGFYFKPRFNVVKYNPYSPAQGEESTQEAIDEYLSILDGYVERVRQVPRVGFDVSASCGMFV